MISSEIRIQLILNHNAQCGIIISLLEWNSIPVLGGQTKTKGILHSCEHASRPCISHNSTYIAKTTALTTSQLHGNKGLSVNRATPEILQRQETKQEPALCLEQSFPWTWPQSAHWTTGTSAATILLAYGRTTSQVRSMCFPGIKITLEGPDFFRQRLSTQHHKKYTSEKVQIQVLKWDNCSTATCGITEAKCCTWAEL